MQSTTETQGRRAHAYRRGMRIPFHRDVAVASLAGTRRSADLSEGGMFLESIGRVEVGQELELGFFLDPRDPPLSLRARVVREQPARGVGLVFVSLPGEARERIRRFVAHHLQRARGRV